MATAVQTNGNSLIATGYYMACIYNPANDVSMLEGLDCRSETNSLEFMWHAMPVICSSRTGGPQYQRSSLHRCRERHWMSLAAAAAHRQQTSSCRSRGAAPPAQACGLPAVHRGALGVRTSTCPRTKTETSVTSSHGASPVHCCW